MAKLVKCMTCDGEVSEAAATCVHCAQPFSFPRPSIVGKGLAILFWGYTIITGFNIVGNTLAGRFSAIEFYLWVLTVLVGWIALAIRSGQDARDSSHMKKDIVR